MAEAFRDNDPTDCQLNAANSSLVTECAREEENTLYTSTTFMIWLRWLRVVRALLWTGGAAGSIIAASHILQSGDSGSKLLAAGCALAGVLLPAVGAAWDSIAPSRSTAGRRLDSKISKASSGGRG
jgi:hypothetical protein